MTRKWVGIAMKTLLLATALGCGDQGPEGPPDAVGMIAQVNMGRDRVNYLMLENVDIATAGRVQLNVPENAKVVWYASGKDVYSHDQSIKPGMFASVWAKGGLIEGTPPQLNATRVEISYVRP